MKRINIRESLLNMDRETDCKYDLTSLYESVKLDDEKKKQLCQYIDKVDIDTTNRFLSNEATSQGLMENASDDIADEELNEWVDDEWYGDGETTYEYIASKSVPDSDGFYTDYTWYRNVDTGENVFVFGDTDIYKPEDGDFDHECESQEEAQEWFDSYNGFDEMDESFVEIESDPTFVDRYTHTLIGDTNAALEADSKFDSWTWDNDDNEITLTTIKGKDSRTHKIPKNHLTRNFDTINQDVDFIKNKVYESLNEAGEFIPFEIVPDNRPKKNYIGDKEVSYKDYDDAKAKWREDFNIADYRDELNDFIRSHKGYEYKFDVDVVRDNGEEKLYIDIPWGDWRHEHYAADKLVQDFFMQKGFLVKPESRTYEEDGSDTYSAEHFYTLSDFVFREVPVNESLTEGIKSLNMDGELQLIQSDVVPGIESYKAKYVSGELEGHTFVFVISDLKGCEYLKSKGFDPEDFPTDALEINGEDKNYFIFMPEELDESVTEEEDLTDWFNDSHYDIIDAGWTEDGEIIVSLNHKVPGLENVAKHLSSFIEDNNYHVIDWNVNGNNVFVFEVIHNDDYNNLANESLSKQTLDEGWFSDDDFEDDMMHTDIYGGDPMYCRRCGGKLDYSDGDGYGFCPDCDGVPEGLYDEDLNEDLESDLYKKYIVKDVHTNPSIKDRIERLIKSEFVDDIQPVTMYDQQLIKLIASNGKVFYLVPTTLSQVDVYDESENLVDQYVFWSHLVDEVLNDTEAGFVYQVVGGDFAGTYTREEVEALPCFSGRYTDDPKRPKLDNQPILAGYLSPMVDGWAEGHKARIRYETQEIYDMMSEAIDKHLSDKTCTLGNLIASNNDLLKTFSTKEEIINFLLDIEPQCTDKKYLNQVKMKVIHARNFFDAYKLLCNAMLKGDGLGSIEKEIRGTKKLAYESLDTNAKNVYTMFHYIPGSLESGISGEECKEYRDWERNQSLNEAKTGVPYKGYTLCYGCHGTDRWYVKDSYDKFLGVPSGFSNETEAQEYVDSLDESLTESSDENWAVFATDESGNEYCAGVYESEDYAHYWAAQDRIADIEYGYGNFKYRVEQVPEYTAELDTSRKELDSLKISNHQASQEELRTAFDDEVDECFTSEQVTEAIAPDGYEPKKKGTAYKVFKVKNGKLYPPMVANPGGADTPVGVWLTADEGEFAGLSKTGRPQVKSTSSGTLSYRPGWHLGDIPRASQFDRTNKETGEKEFPKDFVWAECEYTMDIDYQPESDEQGYMRIGKDGKQYRSDKYQHSLAGLPKLPKDGYYKYRTNPRPDTVPWVITGAIKVNRLLSDAEVNDILASKGIDPIHRQGGDKTLAELGL